MTKYIIGIFALTGATAFGETVYENDFSERRSVSPVPTADWRAVDYVTGLLANTNSAAPFAATAEGQVMQDGWIMSQQDNNKGNARVYADGGNNMATLGHEDGDHAQLSFVKQRLGNTFTNGVVTVQFDFLPPGSWAIYSGDRRAALSIGDEGFYSPSVSQDKVYRHTVGSVGVRLEGSRKVYYNADQDTANTGTTDKEVMLNAWHRAVVTIDLDARKWGFAMYEMGQHPALGAATPATAVYTANDLPFADDTVKSVSSIGLGGFGVVWSAGGYASGQSPTHIAAFDNIRVAHNGVECYVNDFTSGRRRNLDGTVSGAYTPDSLLTSRVENEVYVVGDTHPVVGDLTGANVVQPLGVDGWRRTMHGAGTARAYVSSTTDYTVLRCEGSAKTEGVAYVTHPFGTTVFSGKVKIQVDVRTHSTWTYNAKFLNTAWLTLGDEAHYNATPADAQNHRFTSVGIRATDSATKGSPLYMPPSGTKAATAMDAIAKSKWYRMVVTADIDNGKVVYKLYDQGEASPNSATADGTLLYTSPEFDQLNSDRVKSLSCFSLGTYFCTLYFDNIKVWHTPTGSSDETLLYENYFSSRTCHKRVAKLAGTMSLNPEGQDGWTRLNWEGADVFVTDAANPAVAFARYNSDSFVAHDIGRNVRTGTLTVQADMRPPKGWQGTGGSVYLRLGGDAHIQSSIRDDDTYFLKNIATGFGFRNVGTAKKDNIYTNSTIAAYRGDLNAGGAFENAACAVDPAHWYRFVATVRVSDSEYDVAVYDMGAAQPTLATATPASPVATFSALPFRRSRNDLGGISCYGLSVNRTLYSSVDETLGPLVDNIRITHERDGMMVILR